MSEDLNKLQNAYKLHQEGRLVEAASIYEQLIRRDSKNYDALHFLGTIKASLGEFVEAQKLLERSLGSKKNKIAYVENYASILFLSRDYERAVQICTKTIKENDNTETIQYVLAISLYKKNRLDEAIKQFGLLLSLYPNHLAGNNEKASVLAELEQYDEALSYIEKALTINPRYAEAFLNKGNVLGKLKRYDDSILAYKQALAINPNIPDVHLGCGNVFWNLKRYDEAFAAYDKALTIKPDLEGAWIGRGNVFYDLRRYDEAFAAYDKALTIKPDLENAWLGRGNVFYSLNRDEEALTCYDKAISLKKDLPDGYWNKSLLKLSLGEYEEGWQLYGWRWKNKRFTSPVRNFSQPPWLGNDSIVGKTILVHSEQGFGDTIQFYRYLSKLKTLGCEIVFETQVPLAPLIKAQRDNCQIIGQGETLPSFDVHCPLLSLPLAFKTTLETIPAQVPYLFPPPEKLELWRTKLGTKSKPRIGLVWSGKMLPDFRRSIPLDSLLLIIDEKAEWHSIQKDVRENDYGSLNSSLTIIDHAPSLNDFSDTAALIVEMDIVISVDTAVAHLAGALGKRVWILLPFHPDFRWLRDREDSPWYPTARLFRQTKDGEWESVIDRVSQELKIFLAAS
jgi:hypothetical protein